MQNDAIDLWELNLSAATEHAERLRALLAADERARGDRFHFPRHRERFIVGRAFLRDVLAKYVGLQPNELEFQYGAFGKPELAPQSSPPTFNLTHSGDMALLAVSWSKHRLGVDIESPRERVNYAGLARRFFSAAEVARFDALPEADQRVAFYQFWTRKEAIIKAHGKGLSLPLDSFSVELGDQPSQVVWHDVDASGGETWWLQPIAIESPYFAAVAIDRPPCPIVRRRISVDDLSPLG